MSQTIDEKVVEMKFDNRDFEKNVQTSLSTLEKLKAKLNLQGATKGLEQVQQSASKLSFSSAESSLASLEKRFSTTGIIGMTVIQNLTNSAVNLAKKLSSGALDSIFGGGKRRATNLENARFQLKGLLKDGTKVEAVMKNVNDAVDGTAYSLDAAANVASQLAASGMQAGDQMFKSLRGVAGVAAMTNSSYEDIGRIYTQVAGQGRLMGDQLLQLSGRGMNAAATLAKYLGKTEAEVRDMTSKGKISFEMFANAMDDAFGEHAKEANNTVNGAFANIKSALARIGAEFVSPLITEKGPLVQFLNAVRERINEIKKNIVPIAKEVTDYINNALSKLTTVFKDNNFLGYNPFVKLKDTIKGVVNTIDGTLKPIKQTSDTIKKVTDSVKEYTKIVDEIIYGSWGNGEKRFEALTEAGYNYYKAQNMVNEKLHNSFRYSDEYIAKQDEVINKQSKVVESQEEVSVSTNELIENLSKLSKEQLIQKGYTEEQAEAIKTLGDVSKKTGIPIKELLNLIDNDQFNTRFLIFDSLKNVGMAVVGVLKSIISAFAQVFNPNTKGLFDLIAALHNFTTIIRNKVDKNVEGLTNTLKGLFSIIHIITTIISGGFKLALKVLNSILGAFNLNILDVTGYIGNLIYRFDQWLTKENGIVTALKSFVEWVGKAAVFVRDWVRNNEKLIEIGSKIKSVIKSVRDAFVNLFNGIDPYEGKNVAFNIVKGLVDGIKSFGTNAKNAFGNFVNGLIEFVRKILGIHSPSTVFFAIGGFIVAGLVGGLLAGKGDLLNGLKTIGNAIIGFFQNIKFGDLISVAISAGLIYLVNRIIKLMETIVSPLRGLNNMFNSLAGMFNDFGDAAGAFAKSIKYKGIAEIIKSIAISIGILVAAVVVLGNIEYDKLKQGMISLGILVGVLAAFIGVVGLMSNKLSKLKLPDMGKILALTLGVAGAIWLMGKALKTISNIPSEQIGVAIGGLAACVVGLGALVIAISKCTEKLKGTKNINKMGTVFLKVSVSMLIMASALKKMSKVDPGAIVTTTAIFIAIVGLLYAMAVLNKFSLGGINKAGDTIQAVSVSLLLLVIAMKLASNLKPEAFTNGIKVIGIFLVFVAALMGISKIFKGTEMIKVNGSLLIIVGAIGMLALIMNLTSNMNPEKVDRGIATIAKLSGIVAALILVSKNSSSLHGTTLVGVAACIMALSASVILLGLIDPDKVNNGIKAVGFVTAFCAILVKATSGFNAAEGSVKVLITLTAMIALLSIAMVGLSFIDYKKLLPAASSLGAVITALAGTIFAVGKMKISKGTISTLLILTLVIGALAGIVAVLSMLPNTQGVVTSATAIALLLGALALVSVALNKMDQRKKVNTKAIVQMGELLIVVAGLAGVLALMGNVQNAIQNAGALVILLGAMTLALVAISAVGEYLKQGVLVGVAGLLGITVSLLAVVGVLAIMDGLENATKNAGALAILLGAMTLALVAVSLVGNMVVGVIAGVAGLVVVAGSLFILVGVLAAMQNVSNAIPNALAISLLLTSMADALFKLGIIGPLVLIADIAILGLIGIITTIGLLATAIGALMEKFPKLEEFLNKGLPILEQIGMSIGKTIGNLVAGFMNSVSEELPHLGDKLSEFMTNATPFIDGAKNIDSNMIDGIKALAASVLLLTGANIVESIGNFITKGESFAKLGTELSQFAINAMPFIATISTVDPKVMDGAKSMAEAVLTLTKGNLLDTITGWIKGESDLGSFGSKLGELGKGMSSFVSSLGTFKNDQVDTINCACEALKSIADAASKLPNEGGLAAAFAGENDLKTFAQKLPYAGEGIHGFITKLTSGDKFDQSDIDIVKTGCDALKMLSEVASSLPNEGGLAAAFAGDNDISKFAGKLGNVGASLRGFVWELQKDNVITNDSVGKINSIANILWSISDLGKINLSDTAGKLEDLGSKMSAFATKVREFVTNLQETDTTKLDDAKATADKFVEVATKIWSINIDEVMNDDSTGKIQALADMLTAIGGLANNSFGDSRVPNKLEEIGNTLSILGTKIATFASSMKDINSNDLKTAKENMDVIIAMANSADEKTTQALNDFTDALSNFADESARVFMDVFTDAGNRKNAVDALNGMLDSLKKSIEESGRGRGEGTIYSAALSLMQSAVDALGDQAILSGAKTAGENFGQGFINGMSSKETAVWNAGYGLGEKAYNAAKAAIDSHSPSKKTFKLGKFFDQGFINGIKTLQSKVYNSSYDVGEEAQVGLAKAISRISNYLDADMDVQPTIRPVLDLDDVRNGIGTINSMFSQPNLAVATNLGAISYGMATNRQNGNSDVVSAIDKLRTNLGKQGNSYNINGITYDDGSEVADAVKTLVRAAKVERRK